MEPIKKPKVKFKDLSPSGRLSVLKLIRWLMKNMPDNFPHKDKGAEALEEAIISLMEQGVVRFELTEDGDLKVMVYNDEKKEYVK